jgi:spermidine/putrescine transport system permease protein
MQQIEIGRQPVRSVAAGSGGLRRWLRPRGVWLVVPNWLWAGLFFVLPLCIIVVYSFLPIDANGNATPGFTWDNYAQLNDPLYIHIFWRSILMSLGSTALCLGLGYPLAYFMAMCAGRYKNLCLALVIVPFWTSFLIRTYGWIIVLSPNGLLTGLLRGLHLVTQPLEILFTPFSVMLGMTYNYLPLMIFPLYVSLERVDRRVLEAARDLYADGWDAFRRVTLPLSIPGIVAGSLLVGIPTTGEFLIPDILGGAHTEMIGNAVSDQFLVALDWPFGAAMAMALMVILMVGIVLYLRLVRTSPEASVL